MMLGALFSSFIKTEDRRLDKARQVKKPNYRFITNYILDASAYW